MRVRPERSTDEEIELLGGTTTDTTWPTWIVRQISTPRNLIVCAFQQDFIVNLAILNVLCPLFVLEEIFGQPCVCNFCRNFVERACYGRDERNRSIRGSFQLSGRLLTKSNTNKCIRSQLKF